MGALLDRSGVSALFEAMASRNKQADTASFTFFEKALVLSAYQAITQAGIDAAAPDTLFVVSTTKGNVSLLEGPTTDPTWEQACLGHSAQCLTRFFGNPNDPIVVSNACISGACAQITALRALESGAYKTAVVTGADVLSPFIVSGFQSFKALSSTRCQPFDAHRTGLNLGEAAATLVYQRPEPTPCALVGAPTTPRIHLLSGAIRNDANHISGPSRTGEGLFNALQRTLEAGGIHQPAHQLAFINAHGTATPYNDQMEAIALHRAGLERVPVNSLKAYFGHTLGAAGILETILSMRALEEGVVLPSLGCTTPDPVSPIAVAQTLQSLPLTQPRYAVKMLSGFGGSNAAVLFGLL